MRKKNKRKNKLTRHHIKNTVNGGLTTPENIIKLKNEKHQYFHSIFHNLTFLQSARLLLRTHNMKNGTNFKITKQPKGLYLVGGNYYGNQKKMSHL